MNKHHTLLRYSQPIPIYLFLILMFTGSLPVLAQNFSTITWGTASGQPNATHEIHGEVVNGKLYIFGGYNSAKLPKYIPTGRSSVYDPIVNKWDSISDLPHTPKGSGFGGVTHEGLTTDGTDIYIAGGYTSNSTGTGQVFGTKQVWKYVISTNTYTRLPDLPQALAGSQMRFLNGRLHYMGGTNLSRIDVGVHYALTLNNLVAGWVTLAPLSNPRNHPGSAVYDGKIYFIGGAHNQDDDAVAQKTVEVYNPVSNTWSFAADLPVGRDHISSSVVVIGNRILVLCGETSHNVKIKNVSAFSPATNTWTELTPLPIAKAAGVAAVLNGNIHYTGGNFSNTNYKGIPGGQTSTTTLAPSADAFVRNGSYATINYGNDTALVLKSANVSGYSRSSYLKFSLGTLSNITSARLRIYGKNIDNTTAVKVFAYGVNADGWSETAINFNTAPAASTSVLDCAAVNNVAKYYDIDVTSYVKTQAAGDKVVSLLLKDPYKNNTTIIFNSKEHALNKPQLVITTTSTSGSITNTYNDLLPEVKPVTIPRIFPNPSAGKFVIQFPEHYDGPAFVTLSDQSGKSYNVSEISVPHGGMDADVDITRLSLKSGVYFLKIRRSARTDNIHIIIK